MFVRCITIRSAGGMWVARVKIFLQLLLLVLPIEVRSRWPLIWTGGYDYGDDKGFGVLLY
jgi:hypothetical protein